jgi:adenylate cyclase class IV
LTAKTNNDSQRIRIINQQSFDSNGNINKRRQNYLLEYIHRWNNT